VRLIPRVRSFVSALLFRRRMEREIAQEWQFHVDTRVDDLMMGGLSRAEAEQRAHREFGDRLAWRESSRAVRGVQVIDEAQQDVTHALRQLLRAPMFTLVAVITVALGIGANTAIFSVINAVLLRPLGYKNSDRLVRFIENFPRPSGSSGAPFRVPGMDVADLETLRAHTQTLSHVAVIAPTTMILMGPDDTVRLQGTQVSAAAFPMLGVQALLGRTFDATDDKVAADPVVVLSHAVWRELFGSDPHIVGRFLTLDGTERAVVGVMPPGFALPDAAFPNISNQVWVPFAAPRLPPGAKASRPAIARVKEGITLEAAAAELNAILPAPGDNRPAIGPRFELVRVQDQLVAPVKSALLILAAAVGVVLLIACVNVANLLLARMAAREREFAVRLALGAGRGRLARQVLTESVLLSLIGGIAGTGVAFGGLRVIRTLAASLPRRDLGPNVSLPRLDEIGIDGSVLIFTMAVAILTGVVFGLAPALWHSTQRSMHVLRDGARSSSAGFDVFRRLRMQGVLVIAEIAMAMMLCIGGGLLMYSFAKLAAVNPGYDLEDVLTFQVTLPRRPYTPVQYTTMTEDIATGLRATPRLRLVGYAMDLPLVSGRSGQLLRTNAAPLSQPLPPAPPSSERPLITRVSRDFLSTLGVRLIEGRGLSERDGAEQPSVMLINRTVARSRLLGDHPVGTRVYAFGGTTPIEVIGIVDDMRMLELDPEPVAQAFVDVRQFPPSPAALRLSLVPSTLYYAVRSATGAAPSAPDIRALVRHVDPHTAIDNFATMQQLVSNSIARRRLFTVLLGVFALVAATLAAVGIYGVMAYTVTRRTREIGIRMALGASHRQVMSLVLRQTLTLTAVGIVLGVAGAAGVTRYLGSLLFGVSPLDPRTFFAVALVLGSIATLAASVPARRATRVEPLIALHEE
jgi:putative ABC transport system permease protein